MSKKPIIGICINCGCLLAPFEMENGHNECLSCRDPREEDEEDWEIDPDMGCY